MLGVMTKCVESNSRRKRPAMGLAVLREYREKKGLSGPELARQRGVRHPTVYRGENGARKLTIEQAIHVAKTTGIPLAKLLGLSPKALSLKS